MHFFPHTHHPNTLLNVLDAALASKFADMMLKKNVYVIGFSYPVVPMNLARIRTQISAAHTMDDINRAVDAFIEVGKELKVI